MERIDQVEILEVRRGRFVGHVHGMLEGQIPDGEGLELRVAGPYSPLVVVVELGQAGGQLTAARARAGDDHEGFLGFDILVRAVPLIADDQIHVRWVPLVKLCV